MQYNITGKGIEVTDELRSYAERTLSHADKFVTGDPTAHTNIELEYSAMRDGGKYRAEFNLSIGGALHRAEEWGATLHEAIDLASGELTREVRRAKNKNQYLLRRGAAKVKDYIRGWRGRI